MVLSFPEAASLARKIHAIDLRDMRAALRSLEASAENLYVDASTLHATIAEGGVSYVTDSQAALTQCRGLASAAASLALRLEQLAIDYIAIESRLRGTPAGPQPDWFGNENK